jgi:CRISPR-associated protein Cmr3
MTAQITVALKLEPLDVLFFRDGKPFEAGIRAESTAPLPQTLAGALRTHVLAQAGCDFARLGGAVRAGASFPAALAALGLGALATLACRGPWFQRGEDLCLPMPACLHRVDEENEYDRYVRLAPLRHVPSAWRGSTARPLWTTEAKRTKQAGGWLTLAGMKKFLAGAVPLMSDVLSEAALFARDPRTGIVINETTWTTEEGQIYAADYLALAQDVYLYAELTGPKDALAAAFAKPVLLALGGQGKRVRATKCPPVTWPAAGKASRRLLVLTSPGLFAQGWRPAGLQPVAAAVPGYVAFSGWDLASNGPKPTRFAAAAGSVWFFDSPPNHSGTSLCDSAEDGLVGWGSYLEGTW